MKARVTITFDVDYDINPAYYEGCSTYEEMLALDLKSADNDPYMFLGDVNGTWTVTGKLLKDEEA